MESLPPVTSGPEVFIVISGSVVLVVGLVAVAWIKWGRTKR